MKKKNRTKAELMERLDELFMRLRRKGYSQEKIASKLGISQGHVSKIMSGKHTPSASVLLELTRLAEANGGF